MFKSERIWRILTNFWTIFLGIFFVIDFFSINKFDYLTPTFSVIYTAVLSLYVGTKEFERWCDRYENGRHPGELFIIWWTALMAFLYSSKLFLGDKYSVSPEAVAVYLIVLSLFALTRRSKRICATRKSGGKNKR